MRLWWKEAPSAPKAVKKLPMRSENAAKVLCINNRFNSLCQGTTSVVPHTLQN
jgi:hypothetical protein